MRRTRALRQLCCRVKRMRYNDTMAADETLLVKSNQISNKFGSFSVAVREA